MLALDTATIRQSHDQPTLCTITVDGFKGHQSEATSTHRPEYHWKLPTADPRSERNLPLHLHTLDIYFWTAHNATSFVSIAQGLLQEDQLELLNFPPAPTAQHQQTMSPVVQQLENVVITDPAYHGSRAQGPESTPVTQSQQPGSDLGPDTSTVATPKAQDPNDFKPLAYNPAAPPAPEPIAHREKTPPPIDGEGGTGLASAAVADKMQTMSPQSSLSRPGFGTPQASSGYIGGPPVSPFGGAYVGSPPSAAGPGKSNIPSFAPPPVQPPPNPVSPTNQQLTRLNSPKQQPPLDSPANEILGNSYVGGHHQPLQHVQPQYPDYLASGGHQAETPVGGFSDFKYAAKGQQQEQQQSQSSEYDIHNQVYRPTEEEFVKKKSGKQAKPSDDGGQATPTGKLEERAGKVDKKVNRFFKKLETRIG